jgi:hypothetical protein
MSIEIAAVGRRIFVLEDGETWSAGDCLVTTVDAAEFSALCDGEEPMDILDKDRFTSLTALLEGNIKVVSVAVNIAALKAQRDAVLYCIDDAEITSDREGMAERVNRLDGVMSMLDNMLDLAEDYEG